jgi:hypothetical protein
MMIIAVEEHTVSIRSEDCAVAHSIFLFRAVLCVQKWPTRTTAAGFWTLLLIYCHVPSWANQLQELVYKVFSYFKREADAICVCVYIYIYIYIYATRLCSCQSVHTELYRTVLYSTCSVLYYTFLFYTILYFSIQNDILYCTKQNYTILYCTFLCYTKLYCTILYYTVLQNKTILFCTILYKTILYYTFSILYFSILYCTMLYYNMLYCTVLYYIGLCHIEIWRVYYLKLTGRNEYK